MSDLPMQSNDLILLLIEHGSVIQKPGAVCIFTCVVDFPLKQAIDLMFK